MRSFLLLTLLPLTGCARDDAAYPSLALRPIERVGFEEPTPAPPAPVAVDPALDLEVAAATVRLDKAVGDFTRAAGRAAAAARAARGAAAGSEPWIAAQTALAELDTVRAETSEVLSDLERLTADRAATLAPDYPALETARERAERAAADQAGVIARLGSGLAPA